ncbi:MAG: protein kinase [Hyphomicrobiaceae bacterium]
MMDYREVLQTGTVLDRKYRVDRVIGAGGFGITYQAFDIGLAAPVAIKEYYPAQFGMRDASMSVRPRTENDRQLFDRLRASFLREARTLAQFDHPAIVRVISVFESHGTAYMVMKYESGSSLKAWLQELGRSPSQSELDQLVWPLLDALEAMHRADFLHRDIAPDNIIVRADGSPVLLDFGASRRVYSDMSGTLTGVVKQGYSPQEQYSSDVRVQGPWTDVYAMGATLYLAVTGRVPTEATARMLDDGLEPAVDCARAGYRHGFLAGIDAAMSLRPKDRPQSVREWRDMLFFGADGDVNLDAPGTYVFGMPGSETSVPRSMPGSRPQTSQPTSTPSTPATGARSQPRSAPSSTPVPSSPLSAPPGSRAPTGGDAAGPFTSPSHPITRASEMARTPTGIAAIVAGIVLIGGGTLWAIDAGGSNQKPVIKDSDGVGTVGPPITVSTDRLGQQDAARRAKEEADRLARIAAEKKAQEEAQRRAKEEADRLARIAAEKKAQEEAQRRAKEEADRLARIAAEKKAQEEAQRRAKEEADRLARIAAEKKAKEEADRRAKEEADRLAKIAAEKKAREEADRLAKEAADRRAKELADRIARLAAERQAREAAQQKAREEAERAARLAAEQRAREDAERAARLAAEQKAKEDAEKAAKAQAERLAREDAQRRSKAEQLKQVASLQTPPPAQPITPTKPATDTPLRAAAFAAGSPGGNHFAQSLALAPNLVIAGGADGRLAVWGTGNASPRSR